MSKSRFTRYWSKISQAVEEIAGGENGHASPHDTNEHLSVQDLIQQEIRQAADRNQQEFLSINTVISTTTKNLGGISHGILQKSAGLAIIKVQNPQLDPVVLVERVFNKVQQQKQLISKYVFMNACMCLLYLYINI